ncbi:hypothetical protein F4825DRAFT_425628 [Nemania diffusa]|nr:hypothetical protein F4825DRAFT_425628 [Nemania diffusa]
MNAAHSVLVLTSLTTVVALGIFLLQGNLSLHHASTASSLLTVTIFPTHVLESWRVRSPGLFVSQQARIWMYVAISFWITLQMPCLGTEHQCNLCTRTFVVGIVSHITVPLNRSIRLAQAIITIFLTLRSYFWFYGPIHTLQSVPAMFSRTRRQTWIAYIDKTHESLTYWRIQEMKQATMRLRTKIARSTIRSISYFWLWYDDDTTVRAGIEGKQWRKLQVSFRSENRLLRVWADAKVAIRIPRCQRAGISFIITAILIYNIERGLDFNFTASKDDWGYGQTFALVATTPSVATVITVLLRIGKKPETKTKRVYTL